MKSRLPQDSNLRGQSPVAFEATALTARPDSHKKAPTCVCGGTPTCGLEPTRAEPSSFRGYRLNRSARWSSRAKRDAHTHTRGDTRWEDRTPDLPRVKRTL